jgi:hypothetical protein
MPLADPLHPTVSDDSPSRAYLPHRGDSISQDAERCDEPFERRDGRSTIHCLRELLAVAKPLQERRKAEAPETL